MGCVLPAGLGQAPARQAAIEAGLATSTPCATINKMCGSGMFTVMQAHDQLKANSQDVIIAGGMENMSRAPYLIPKARFGYRFGHDALLDHMMLDGLEDAYQRGQAMGAFAELCAEKFDFSRKQQDDFALQSLTRSQQATESGIFKSEIHPINVLVKKSDVLIEVDEGPSNVQADKIPMLKPAFKPDGTVTAANASSISDGAAALLLTRRNIAKQQNLPILATIRGHSTYAGEPAWFTTAPIFAIEKLIHKINWSIDQIDLFEINEAFAVVTMAAIKQLTLRPERVNVHGGACVLGHPIGASGARILVSLLHALQYRQQRRGIAALCIGGGEATAIAVEMEN